ncbi:MAG: hypothetical protein ACYTDY_15430 [Planctomycetota bacterium]|jgi:hypothetical protein
MRNRIKDLAVILGTAALTALVAALLLAPETTVAKDEDALALLVSEGAKLEAEGLTLTVDAGEKVRKAGEKPVFTLKAVSTAKKTVCVDVEVELTSMWRESFFMRSMPLPKKIWTERVEAKVAPGKTREIEISADCVPDGDTVVSINLSVGKQKVYAGGFGVEAKAPAAEPPATKQKP